MSQVAITALLPIKGASERVSGKNMRPFCGKPLLHYVLQTLENSSCVKCIVINTDAEIVARHAREYCKVIIHERPDYLCGHDIPMNSIIAYDIALLGETHFLQTHVTNPLLTAQTLARAVSAYFERPDGCDALFSVVAHQNRFFRSDHTPINHDPRVLQNTQDLSVVYEENSCLYLFSRQAFTAGGNNRLGRNPMFFVMDKLESMDIDTEEDFRMTELAWKMLNG